MLLAYADHADDSNGICWPKKETIAGKTGMSIRTVQAAVAELGRLGYLRVHRYPNGGRGRSTEYVVAVGPHALDVVPPRSDEAAASS